MLVFHGRRQAGRFVRHHLHEVSVGLHCHRPGFRQTRLEPRIDRSRGGFGVADAQSVELTVEDVEGLKFLG